MESDSHFIDLFSEDIFILDGGYELDNSNQPEESKIATTVKRAEIDANKIYIYTENSFSSENKTFLEKILQAVKINISSDCIIIENTTKESIKNDGKYFYFGNNEQTCSIIQNGIIAPDLGLIAQNIDLKKSIWALLQKIYL